VITPLKRATLLVTPMGDNQNTTAKSPGVKSHPGFHALNLLYALAWRALARA
jgi:hypothetical protein